MNKTSASCNEYVWKIGPYVDGELSLHERDGLENHLDACADCREMATSFRDLDKLAGQATSGASLPAVSGREWATLLENVTREDRVVEPMPHRRAWEWLVPASALAALLVIGVFLGRRLLERDDPALTPVVPHTAHTAARGDPDDVDVPIGAPETGRDPETGHDPETGTHDAHDGGDERREEGGAEAGASGPTTIRTTRPTRPPVRSPRTP